jgi:hypothetical protein
MNEQELKLDLMQSIRLLAAFQAMDMTAALGAKKCFGVSNRQACKIVEEMTGIKPKGNGRGRIRPAIQSADSTDALQGYLNWLSATGTPRS